MKISDHEAYAMLRKYGISCAEERLVQTEEELRLVAENIGYPLVLKVDSPDIMHKLRSGCVKFVDNEDTLLSTYRLLLRNASKLTSRIFGVIVQKMVAQGVECIAGGLVDEQFGRVIMFGSGGALAEAVRDVSFRLVPVDAEAAREMLSETRVSALLSPVSGAAAIDILQKMSNLMENEAVQEIDVNPVIASRSGAVAADVRILC